jgi:hypothetical protein
MLKATKKLKNARLAGIFASSGRCSMIAPSVASIQVERSRIETLSKWASSAEFVGELGLRQMAKLMI